MGYRSYCLVCSGDKCKNEASREVYKELRHVAEARGVDREVQVVRAGCFGLCRSGPIVKLLPDETLYVGVQPDDAQQLVDDHIAGGKPVERLMLRDEDCMPHLETGRQTGFYQKQVRLVLRNCGLIDPDSIDEYIARQGYAALEKVLTEMSADDVIGELKASGLRGRGGAGFPAHLKWNFTLQEVRRQARENPDSMSEVSIVCNGDEGDPGAYMDRSVLEGDPHSVIEAMAIAGYTMRARRGYIYVRAEYPLAIARLEHAIAQAHEYGLLGRNILETGFDFEVEIRLGAGAFVCGEETALLASIQGERGTPWPRPPYPAVVGLWDGPTVINNVETWANVPLIMLRGGEWFSRIGTESSSGTKVFALTGKVNNTGLVEVPMGITLREIVYDIGGGVRDGKEFKAVQTGGPSGGVLTAEHLDTPIDFDSLSALGSMMGSGGMIVMDEDDCMVDVTRFYLEFSVDESCGKCAPCRIGGQKLHSILSRITEGRAHDQDLENLDAIGNAMQHASLCGLGQTAPNPVISTLQSFRDEYEAHIRDRRCPARHCKALVRYEIDPEACIGCTVCARKCPVNCIHGERKAVHWIDQEECIKCGECYAVCKFGAVRVS